MEGGLAAVNAGGFYGPATGAPSEILVGRFYKNTSNVGGADGATFGLVRYFRERRTILVSNDTMSPVLPSARDRFCSTLDDATVTSLVPTSSRAGIVYDVNADGTVWLEGDENDVVFGSLKPLVQRGTTTLVAGTKTVSGVILTAGSSIQLTIRDPGAGVLATFVGLAAPVASRNVGAGSFVINAMANDKSTLATAVCVVDYLIVG